MDTDFCVDTLEKALNRYGEPDIFNSDQGVIPPYITEVISRKFYTLRTGVFYVKITLHRHKLSLFSNKMKQAHLFLTFVENMA